MMLALSLRNVSVRYGISLVVNDVSLDVHRGELVALVGPNGSGKSTTLAVAAGLLDPIHGSAMIGEIDQRSQPASYARCVGLVPQECALYDELTARQNLEFFAKLYDLKSFDRESRVCRALARARLIERANDRVETFSGGMKQRLSVAVALLHDPCVLLLDEPTSALDPASRQILFAELQRLRDDGHAILLTTHHLDEIEYGCDRIAMLNHGRLVSVGTPSELMRQPASNRAVLYGQLTCAVPKYVERRVRERLTGGAELEITGRRVRLSAWNQQELGRALAVALAEGVEMTTFRTPSGRLDQLSKVA